MNDNWVNANIVHKTFAPSPLAIEISQILKTGFFVFRKYTIADKVLIARSDKEYMHINGSRHWLSMA